MRVELLKPGCFSKFQSSQGRACSAALHRLARVVVVLVDCRTQLPGGGVADVIVEGRARHQSGVGYTLQCNAMCARMMVKRV